MSHQAIVTRINVELANDLGNLAQRSLSLVARNCGGVLPGRGRSQRGRRRAWTRRPRALPGLVRAHLERQGFHDALEEVWKVIRAANGYIDRQAPWALNRTDKARMGTVLRVLADTLRVVATVLQPFMPDSMSRMLDQLGVAADQRQFAALGDGLAGRHQPAGAAGRVSRVTWNRARRRLMLIDSHCHLDYFTPMELPEVLARAAARRGGRGGDHRHHSGAIAGTSGADRGARQCLVHHRRASAPRRGSPCSRTGNAGRAHPASEGDRHRRVRAWTTSTTARRARCRARTSAPISAARAWPGCRWPSTRATPTPISRGSCRKNATRAGFRVPAALLQLLARAGRGGDRDGRLCQLLRHPDLPAIQ